MTLPELSAKISGAIAGKAKLLLDDKQDRLAVTGAANKGVYVSAAGVVSPMTYELNANVPANFAPGTAAPLMDGTAAVGTSAKYAREDHRHPVDTSRASADDLAALRNYIASMDVYRITSGNPATFYDAKAANVKALSVTIMPAQSGSGDPSPTNIRPIIGVSSVTVTRTGENGANPQTVSVTLTDGTDPLTVYGGTLDVTAGELTVTHNRFHFNASTPIRTISATTSAAFFALFPYRLANGDNGLCSMFPVHNIDRWAESAAGLNICDIDADSIKQLTLKVNGCNTEEDYRAWLGTHEFDYVYPLAAPVTYQLTPTQLATLSGYNAVSADAGAVDVTYKADTSLVFGGG